MVSQNESCHHASNSTYKEKKDKSIMEELKKWRNCAMMTNMKNFNVD
jgi:hypothetical protein